MHIVDAIPLLPIPKNQPQILSYFWPEPVKPGSLVSINVRNRKEKAVVLISEPLAKRKILLRKGGEFQLKKLDKVLSEPIISENQIKLALWLSDYYYAPLGLCIKLFIPRLRQGYGGQAKINQAVNLIILPEISWINYVTENYKLETKNYSILHSGLSKKELTKEFSKIFSGQADTIVSTRMGLFLSYSNLKTITIYDEGDEAYFSDMTPKYNAVVVAQKLAEIYGAKITFVSEYPSIPDPYETADKYFTLLNFSEAKTLDGKPNTKIINLIDEIKSGNFGVLSNYLREKISEYLGKPARGGPGGILLFVGRRGYAPAVICKKCSSSFKCPNCDASMVAHKYYDTTKYHSVEEDILICHHCEHSQEIPKFCPACGGYQVKGIGVGIQKVEYEITRLRQGYGGQEKILRLDSDKVKNNKEAKKVIEQFNNNPSIMIATQMVFPFRNQIQPTIVGVIDSDTLISIPDYKAQNKLFRQLYLLKNMAGEEFIIQTRAPKNTAILKAANGDFKNFNLEELENRKLFEYPPYGRIIKLSFKHPSQQRALKEGQILAEKLKQASKQQTANGKWQIVGPSPAFIPKVAKNWIFNIIIKISENEKSSFAKATEDLRKHNELLRYVPPGWQIEIDPAQII